MDLTEAYAACAALVQSADEDRYLAALLADAPTRDHLMALYAFNLELAKIPLLVSEPMLGEIRLQWWREVLDQIFSGQEVRNHDVARALADTVKSCALTRENFDRLSKARGVEFYEEPFSGDLGEEAYWQESEGALLELALAILGESGSKSLADRAVHWGRAVARAKAEEGHPFAKRLKTEPHAMTPVRFSAGAAPAVLHFALTDLYATGKRPSGLKRRWRLLKANLTGRL
ncbi:MAG: hypothetical protein EP347_01280 [Alphaproteobacteria bacterium]|nr:MAG: hypothetical protein EP347_01280 [Alphaproteobacteria bacterium]